MKLFFKYIIVIFFFSSCGENKNELDEFIRLEKELVEDCIRYDSTTFTNRYKEMDDRQREYTDSIMDISDVYDKLILQVKQNSYAFEMDFIKSKIRRRIAFNPRDWIRGHGQDTSLQINDSLDIEFIKSSERIHLSEIFRRLSPGFQYGCYTYYSPRKYKPFYMYKKQDNKIIGEFNIGENIILDWNGSEMSFSKNKLMIKPLTYDKDSFMTTASYLPIDTGMYILLITHKTELPMTGKDTIFKKSKLIYVKPKKD